MAAPVALIGGDIAAELIGGFARLVGETLQAALAIDQLTKQTNASAETLQELRFAVGQNGLTFGQFDKAFSRLQTNVGRLSLQKDDIQLGDTSASAAAFEALGLTLDSIANQGTEETFRQIADRLLLFNRKAERAAILAAIFGEEIGPKLVPLFEKGAGGLDESAARARQFGAVGDADAIPITADIERLIPAARQAAGIQIVGGTIEGAQAVIEAFEGLDSFGDEFERILNGVLNRIVGFFDPPAQEFESRADQLIQEISEIAEKIGTLESEVEALGGPEFSGGRQGIIDRLLRNELVPRLDEFNRIIDELEQTSALPSDHAVQPVQRTVASFTTSSVGSHAFALPMDQGPGFGLSQAEQDVIDFAAVAERAFESYANSATNVGAQVEQIIGGSLMNMENALVRFVQTGQLNFRALVDSLLADLIRLTIRAAILGPLARALGAAFGNGLGPQFTGTGFEGLLSSGSFAGGGSFVVGGGGGSDSRLVAFRATPGERVDILTPRQQEAAGPGGAVVNVNVINQAGAEVETRERPNGRGGVDLELLITRAVARDITRGGPVARSVLGLTGTGPALIGR